MDFCPCVERNPAEVVVGVSQNPNKNFLGLFSLQAQTGGADENGTDVEGVVLADQKLERMNRNINLGKTAPPGHHCNKKNRVDCQATIVRRDIYKWEKTRSIRIWWEGKSEGIWRKIQFKKNRTVFLESLDLVE